MLSMPNLRAEHGTVSKKDTSFAQYNPIAISASPYYWPMFFALLTLHSITIHKVSNVSSHPSQDINTPLLFYPTPGIGDELSGT